MEMVPGGAFRYADGSEFQLSLLQDERYSHLTLKDGTVVGMDAIPSEYWDARILPRSSTLLLSDGRGGQERLFFGKGATMASLVGRVRSFYLSTGVDMGVLVTGKGLSRACDGTYSLDLYVL